MRTSRMLVASAIGLMTVGGLAVVACSDAGGEGNPVGASGGSGGGASGSGGSAEGGVFTGGSGGGSGSGGSATDGSVLPGTEGGLPQGCATDSYTGEIVPLDMHVMLDKSGSMSAADQDGGPSRWSQVTNAITEFMALPGTAQIGMGMAFFPVEPSVPAPVQCQGPQDCLPYSDKCMFNQCMENQFEDDSCVATDYRNPAVPINLLPGIATEINAAMSNADTGGMTPMAPALWGALEYARDWSLNWPDHVTLVVLATDGYPTHCVPEEIEDVAAIAEGGFVEWGIKTFVIGIGTELTNLNMIAQRGGTDEAIMVDTGNAGAEFLDALNQIRGSVGCTYKIPVPEEGDPDPNKLNVAFTPEGGAQEVYPRVDSEADCEGEKGWYYDDPIDPNQIILCPASCEQVQHESGVVDVVIGCQSVVK